MTIGAFIYKTLHDNFNVENSIGDKIFPMVAEQGTALPYVVYQAIGVEPVRTKYRRPKQNKIDIQITCYHDRYDKATLIMRGVRALLEGYKGERSNISINNIVFTNSRDMYDKEAKVMGLSMDFKIWLNTSYDYSVDDYDFNEYQV